MALFEDGLATILLAESTITDIVGTRIYPSKAPQDASYPCIVYQRITGPRDATHDGGATQYSEAIFQFSCWAKTTRAAKVLARALSDFLHERSGAMGGTTNVASFVVDQREDQADDVGLFREMVDVRFNHEEE